MTNWIDLTNYAVAVAGFMTAVLGFVFVLSTRRYLSIETRWFFTILFSLLIAYIGSDLLSQISLEIMRDNWPPIASQGFIFLESFFSSLLMPLLSIYMLHLCGEKLTHSHAFFLIGALWLLYVCLLTVAQFTTAIYCFTPDNVYHRGPWYPVLLVPVVLLVLVNLFILLHRRRKLTCQNFNAFLIYLLVPLACMLIQMLFYGLLMILLGTAVASMFMFMAFLSEQTTQYVQQLKENTRLKANNMVLQMRPHFIYNTMTSIYYLCGQDAAKAQKVILDFSSYLRKNFTALTQEETIPFSDELEHTRAYLAVEEVRFEGMLFVEFDTPHTIFRIPPLTLQPIVENSVKHGVDPELNPLHIRITTRECDGGSEIVVEDSGPGFVPAEDGRTDARTKHTPADSAAHVALANIRERLALQGGSMEITASDSGGTRVRILLI